MSAAAIGKLDDVKTQAVQKTTAAYNWTRVFMRKYFISVRAVLGELLVTFLFIYVAASCSANLQRAGVKDPNSPALCVAFAAVALIYSFADISGAHFNPAVTVATMLRGLTHWVRGLFYIAAQLTGATLAILILDSELYPGVSAADLIVMYPSDAYDFAAYTVEALMTFILVFVIFATAFDTVDENKVVEEAPAVAMDGAAPMPLGSSGLPPPPNPIKSRPRLTVYTANAASKAGTAPLSIGLTLGVLCYVGSTVSGGAFNPARVFGAALVAGDFSEHWIYWMGDLSGAALAALVQLFFATKRTQQQATPTELTNLLPERV
ncbi:putative MIP plasma membrane transporter [Paratrimastix pyriformis]|uniref:MIP plasma membrane transporter n=1 Tax=Paratrimastix pyriformis TaxID=342808 RepID=A0ABQ8UVS4_9EUKA|nr:putative MIP plasma membrane transporter [Paratrimastix pyriformis]|eukprot:GAFH01000864.1.p2 GENE.GAFH01000864.1~~GAFH01000864.1.p2  ORF type:complete len:321 (-),score=92.35 GAFH01000864.1:284-1246(-)